MRAMRDSGVEWIGEMPDGWDTLKGKYVLTLLQRSVRPDDGVITCFRDGEVTLRSNRREDGFTMSDREIGYQGINAGDLVIHGMDGFAGAIGISDSRGKGSPVLIVLDSEQNKRYLMYYIRCMAMCKVFEALSTGIRVRSCDLSWQKLANLPFPIPPLDEQRRIADYLDARCADIDAVSQKVRSEIDLLGEYRKSVIYEAVTKGLDKGVPMRDSATAYWGEVPAVWDLLKVKYVFEIVKRIAGREGFDILSITQRGIQKKDLDSVGAQVADDYSGYQLLYPGEFAMNHMDLLTGWIDISPYFGVTSPDYRVFKLIDSTANERRYFKYVMQCCYLCQIFYSLGSGVANKGRWRLQADTFKNFVVPIPPLDEQRRIADYLDARCADIDAVIARKRQQLDVLADYRKSLIYEYVTGKREVA